jgi:serine protease Do
MPEQSNFASTRRRWLASASLALAASLALPLLAPLPADASNNRFTALVKAVQEAKPSIVSIHGRKTVRAENASFGAEGFKQVNGMGTGIVFDSRGYIVTNFHVVEGVSNIQVSLSDERTMVARMVAHDPKTDLAVIKIETSSPLPVIRFGTSCDLMEAEPVAAIGNAYGYEGTATRGIISALHRSVQVSDEQKYLDLIQTDASINPGNSGGPLLNIDGQVIGINVAVRVGAQGIGFAIPIDEALEVAARLMSTERIEQTTHGIIGKTVFTPEQRTFVVTSVRSDSPAGAAGLKAGDVVVRIGDKPIERALDVELAMLGRGTGEQVPLHVTRDSEPVALAISLSPLARQTRPILAERVWDTLGVKLANMDEAEFRQLNSRYRGGLQVLEVRPGGPASAQGIRRGDVLVGMHVWETISMENVAYILEREDLAKLDPVVFYIVRGTDTLYGHLRIAQRTTP